MKKAKSVLCLALSLLLALPLLAGCNDAAFTTDPAGESESVAVSAPSKKESEAPESPSPAPETSPSPLPSYSELPVPVEEICWGSSILKEGSGGFEIDGVTFYSFYTGHLCSPTSEDHVIAFFSA